MLDYWLYYIKKGQNDSAIALMAIVTLSAATSLFHKTCPTTFPAAAIQSGFGRPKKSSKHKS